MSYRKVFINPYPEGWVDLPNEDTSISAAALQAHTDAIEKMDSYLEKIGKAEDAGYIQMNMFNMSTVYLGKKLGDEGELVDDPGSMTTDFIEIDDKLQYMLSALNDSECSVKVHAYNSDFEWMMLCAMQTFYDNVVFPFAVINGAKYIKVSLSKDAKEVVLEDGYITHPYLPSNKELAAELSEQKESLTQYEQSGFLSYNLWDEHWQLGDISSSDGKISASQNYMCSSLIDIQPSTEIFLRTPNTIRKWCYFYKADGTYLGSTTVIRGNSNEVFSTPSEAYLMRFMVSVSDYGSSTYRYDICLNLNSEKNGAYNAYAMPNTELTQITDELKQSLAQLATTVAYSSNNVFAFVKVGRLVTMQLASPSSISYGDDMIVGICPDGYRPFGEAIQITKIFNGAYVECQIRVNNSGQIYVQQLNGQKIENAQFSFLKTKQLSYISA